MSIRNVYKKKKIYYIFYQWKMWYQIIVPSKNKKLYKLLLQRPIILYFPQNINLLKSYINLIKIQNLQ